MNSKKSKICITEGCDKKVYAKNLCRICYFNQLRQKTGGFKPIGSFKNKSNINTLKKVKHSYFGFKSEISMFKYLWQNYPTDKNGRKYCQFTGLRIDQFEGTYKFLNCFSHILPKGLYPIFKLNPKNIRIVHPDFHQCTENFTKDMKVKYPEWDFEKWFNLVSETKISYKKFAKDNLII